MMQNKSTLQTMELNAEAAEKFEKDMKSRILDDIFWIRVEKMIKVLGPICNLITELETNKLLIHKVYSSFSNILSTLFEILPDSILTKAEENDIFANDVKIQLVTSITLPKRVYI